MESARTRIVCTLGPASANAPVLKRMIEAGMDVARLNFSHGTYAQHTELYKLVRRTAKAMGKPVAILQDLQGPKMRLALMPEGGVVLREGKKVLVTKAGPEERGSADVIPVVYAKLYSSVSAGDRILLDDGKITLQVTKATKTGLHVVVKNEGVISSRKGVHLPDSAVRMSALTDKDWADAAFGLSLGVDILCVSFVEDAKPLIEMRAFAKREARKHGVLAPLIMAKVERKRSLEHLDEIIAASDAVMLGRGDLGVEVPPEEVPVIQKDVVDRCRRAGVPVIVATHMLESMREEPRATRAEYTDIATAVFDYADAVMLSAETASGEYPVPAVKAMASVLHEAENSRYVNFMPHAPEVCDVAGSLALALHHMARHGEIHSVAVLSPTAEALRSVSMFRPAVPVFVAVASEAEAHRVVLRYAVQPFIIDMSAGTLEDRFLAHLRKEKLIKSRESIAIIRAEPKLHGLKIRSL